MGQPVTLNIAAAHNGMIPVTIISIPPGAALKIDDHPVGTTPIAVRVLAGTHNLELSKEGYAVAKTPLDVKPDEAPGGSITITLGGLANDTVELRDGSTLTGDVISLTVDSVVINIQGRQQTFERNQISKIFLVERIVTRTSPGESTPKVEPAVSQTPHP